MASLGLYTICVFITKEPLQFVVTRYMFSPGTYIQTSMKTSNIYRELIVSFLIVFCIYEFVFYRGTDVLFWLASKFQDNLGNLKRIK